MSLGLAALRSIEAVDGMSGAMREVVHDYGLPIVTACHNAGVRNPANIRQLVNEIWRGARQSGQRGGVLGTADMLLAQSAGHVSLRTLFRVLNDGGFAVVPFDATRAMLEASMSEVSGFNVRCTREEKHRRRLRAANRAGMNELLSGK